MNILTDEDEEPINEAIASQFEGGTLKRNKSSPTLARLAYLMEGNLIDAKVNIPGISTSQRSLHRMDIRHDSISSLTSVASSRSTSSTRTPNIPISANVNRFQVGDAEDTYYGTDEESRTKVERSESKCSKTGKPKVKKKSKTPFSLKKTFNKIKGSTKVSEGAKAYVPFDPDQYKDDILDEASASNSYPSGQEYSQEKSQKKSVPIKQHDSRYSQLFAKYDHDGSGSLSKAEFKAVFQEYGLRWSREMDKKFDEWDSSGDGQLSITEFTTKLADPNYLKTFLNKHKAPKCGQEEPIYSSIDEDVFESPEVQMPAAPQAPPMIMGMSRPMMSHPIKVKSPPLPQGSPMGPPKGIPVGIGGNPFMAELNKKLIKRNNSGSIPVKISRNDSIASTASIQSPDSAKIFNTLGMTGNEDAMKSPEMVQGIKYTKKGDIPGIKQMEKMRSFEQMVQNLNIAVENPSKIPTLNTPQKPLEQKPVVKPVHQVKSTPQKTMVPKPKAKPTPKRSPNFLGEKGMGGANDELFNLLKKRRPKSFLPQESNPEPEESNPEPEESNPEPEESNPEPDMANPEPEIQTNPDPEQEISVPDDASKNIDEDDIYVIPMSNMPIPQEPEEDANQSPGPPKPKLPPKPPKKFPVGVGLFLAELNKRQNEDIPQEPETDETDNDSLTPMTSPINYVQPTDSPSLPKKRSFRNSFRKKERRSKNDESDSDVKNEESGFPRKKSRKSKKSRNRSGNEKMSPTADPVRNSQKSQNSNAGEEPPLLPKKPLHFKRLQYQRILSGAINPKPDLEPDYIQHLLNDINHKIMLDVMSDEY